MQQKTALVIGGSRGIGRAIVARLRHDGWQVAYTYANAPDADSPALALRADVREPASVAAAFDAAVNHFGGGLGCAIVNAGINVPARPVADFTETDFRALVEINYVGAFNALAEAARRVSDNGNIIGLTTSLVRHAVAGTGPYAATKAAVEVLLRVMQKELAPRGIRVNGVAPGPVDTDLFRKGKDAAAVARSAAMSPFNRVGSDEEIAAVVAFLASDEASWMAGQIVQPNGALV